MLAAVLLGTVAGLGVPAAFSVTAGAGLMASGAYLLIAEVLIENLFDAHDDFMSRKRLLLKAAVPHVAIESSRLDADPTTVMCDVIDEVLK